MHYYEQGNVSSALPLDIPPVADLHSVQVQLETKHAISLALPPTITADSAAPSAPKVLALIETEEGKYQESLGETYQEMGEKTFKGLRRALPMTRSKLDWDKVRLTAALGVKLELILSVCPLQGARIQVGRGVVVEQRWLRWSFMISCRRDDNCGYVGMCAQIHEM